METSVNKQDIEELDDDISFFRNISSQVVSTPQVKDSSAKKFQHTPSNGLTLSMLVSPSNHHNVTYSNLNTEEKKVFLPSEHKFINTSKCNSSELLDRSSETFEPKHKNSLPNKLISPLLFDSEQSKTTSCHGLVNGSFKRQKELCENFTKYDQEGSKVNSKISDSPASESDETIPNGKQGESFIKKTVNNHVRAKTNPCKVLFDTSDNSIVKDCGELDSPINITSVTPSYEKLKSSLNNSKKSNNGTKIDNLSICYLDELIELKSEDKEAAVKLENKTPTRNNGNSLQAVPRMLNFVNDRNTSTTYPGRSTSPNLDDTVRITSPDSTVGMKSPNLDDTVRITSFSKNIKHAEYTFENEINPRVKSKFSGMEVLKNIDIPKEQATLMNNVCSQKNKFIYPNNLYKNKDRNLISQICNLNVNKAAILELETMKEMSDVNDVCKTKSTEQCANTKGCLITFSDMLKSSQDLCQPNLVGTNKPSNPNRDFTNTQLDSIYEKLEKDHSIGYEETNKEIIDVNDQCTCETAHLESSLHCHNTVETNKPSNQNRDFTNTQIDSIFEKLEKDHPNDCLKVPNASTKSLPNIPNMNETEHHSENTEMHPQSEFINCVQPFLGFDYHEKLDAVHKKKDFSQILTEIMSDENVKHDDNTESRQEDKRTSFIQIQVNINEQVISECNTGDKCKRVTIENIKTKLASNDLINIGNDTKASEEFRCSNITKPPPNNSKDVNSDDISRDLGKFTSFKSASGRKIQINPNSLKKAREIFDSLDAELKINAETPSNSLLSCKKSDGYSESMNEPISRSLGNKNNEVISVNERFEVKHEMTQANESSVNVEIKENTTPMSAVSKELNPQPKIESNVAQKSSITVEKQAKLWDAFEDSFVVPQTQDILFHRKNKYNDVTMCQTNDDLYQAEPNNDISNTQFHMLGEFVEKLSTNEKTMEQDCETLGTLEHVIDVTIPIDVRVPKPNRPTIASANHKESTTTRPVSPDLSHQRKDVKLAQMKNPFKDQSENSSVSNKVIHSRSKSPDFSCSKSDRSSRNDILELLETSPKWFPNPLDKGKKKCLVNRPILTSGNLAAPKDSNFLNEKKCDMPKALAKSGKHVEKKSTKDPSCKNPPTCYTRSPSPDLNCNFGNLKMKTIKTFDVLVSKENICFKNDISSQKQITSNKSGVKSNPSCTNKMENGFRGFSRDVVLTSANKIYYSMFHCIEEEFKGFSRKSVFKITCAAKKKFILECLLGDTEKTPKVHCHAGEKLDNKLNTSFAKPTLLPLKSLGFTTARGKTITVSEESIQKGKQILDISQEALNVTTSPNISEEDVRKTTPNKSPETSNSVGENPKHVSKSIAERTEHPIESHNTCWKNSSTFELPTTNVGFKTASGNKLSVSKESLEKAKKLMDSIDPISELPQKADSEKNDPSFLNEKLDKSEQFIIKSSNNTKLPKTPGFPTASGKVLTVREDNIMKAREHDPNNSNAAPHFALPTTRGFVSASGKKLTVSEESIKKAKQLLENIDNDIPIVPPKSANNGFTSASGKKLTVSEESLKKAKQLFDDIDEDTPKVQPKSAIQGFTSASGKKLTVSEESLKKAKQLFDDIDEDTPKVQPKSAIQGFASASGKKLTVSEESLKKAKQLFDNIDEDPPIVQPKSANNGFTSASGKKLTVSEESLKKAKQLFDDIDEDTPKVQPKSAIQGFASASGKKLTVAEESLKKAKQLFDNIDEDTPKVQPKSAIQGFASASGKKLTVSEESLKKAKQLFDDIDEDTPKVQPKSAIQGFTSASGKKLTVSEESLKKAKQLFDDIDEDTPKVQPKSAIQGFASASGKKLTVSEESLKKAKQLFDDIDEDTPKVQPKSAIQGFTSASGKKLTVSEESLKKAKQLFDDIDEDTPKVQPKSAIQGFASASGKKLTVAEESLKKAKQFFDNIDEDTPRVQPKSAIQGFASASGKKLTVSEESLKKAKQLFDDIDEDTPKVQPKSAIQGFASASGKKLTVSEESLKKAKQLFDDIDEDTPKVQPKSANNGFTSASGKKLTVSEESLKKAKQLFDDIDEDTPKVQPKSAIQGFASASGKKLTVSEESLKKAKQLIDNIDEEPQALQKSNSSHEKPKENQATSTNRPRSRLKTASPDLSDKTASRFANLSSDNISEFLASEFNLTENKLGKRTKPMEARTNKRRKLCFTQEKDDSQTLETTGALDETLRIKILAERLVALEIQRKMIKERCELSKKGQYQVDFELGAFYKAKQKKSQRVSFSAVTSGKPPGLFTSVECIMLGLSESVLSMSPDKAVDFQFDLTDHYTKDELDRNTSGVLVGDNVRIILNQQNRVGLPEIQAGFLSSPGVNCAKVCDKWVENHFCLLVWKLCCLERSYPDVFKGKLCTLDNLLYELKYRYDCEMENQSSCLKKVVQCDDAPNKRMVLCVSRVSRHTVSGGTATQLNRSASILEEVQLEVTDGWYRIRAVVDEEMKALVARQGVKLGTKLITCNAELYNNDQGCDPLHMKADIYLKLHTNSTRRAHWQSRLGYCPVATPLPISLSSVLPRGGLVSQVRVLLARIYPTLYLEKNTGGKATIRNEKTENLALMKFQKYYEKQLELIYTRLKKQNETEEGREGRKKQGLGKLSKAQLSAITSGEELYNLVSSNFDSAILNHLSEEQLSALEKYKISVRDQIAANINQELKQEVASRTDLNRQVTSLMKIKIYDVTHDQSAMLTIWRPDPNIHEILREGKLVRLQYVTASGFRYGETQLSSTKHTRFKPLPSDKDTDDLLLAHSRHVSLIGSPIIPRFGEIDVVGLVAHSVETGNKTVVYLANERRQFLAVHFWNGVKESGYEDVLRVGSVVACSNLQYRPNATADLSIHHTTDLSDSKNSSDFDTSTDLMCIPSSYSTEHSMYSRNPRSKHLSQQHAELTAKLKTINTKEYLAQCQSLIQSAKTVNSVQSNSSLNQSKSILNQSNGIRNPSKSILNQSNSSLNQTKSILNQSNSSLNLSKSILNQSSVQSHPMLSRKRPSLLENELGAKKSCRDQHRTLGGTTNQNQSVCDSNLSHGAIPSLEHVSTLNHSHPVGSKSNAANLTGVDTTLSNTSLTSPDVNASMKSSIPNGNALITFTATDINAVKTSVPNGNASSLNLNTSVSNLNSSVLTNTSLNTSHSSVNANTVASPNVGTPNQLILHKRTHKSVTGAPSGSTPQRLTSSSLLTSTPNSVGREFGAQFSRSFDIPGEDSVTPIQKKIRTLERYGEPPPLSPSILSLRSKKLLKPFRVPKK
ncbi:hypothetical protein M8J77_012729 [Diaphorina citri]|nr:hypothetical protein M8J77_012729 [Diaphorina citri]